MKTICFVTGLMLLLAVNRAQAQKNLVTNGGFEDSEELYGWNNNGAKTTPWDIKVGKYSCAIITANTSNWVGMDQTVRIPKKVQTLEFSAWLKTINVVKGKDDWDGAIFTVEFLDNRDKKIGDGTNIARLTGDQVWTLSKQVIATPAGAVSFRVLLALGNASGTMLIDEVTVKAVDSGGTVKS